VSLPAPAFRPLSGHSSDVTVVLRRSASASARPPPSPRPFERRLSDVTVLLRRRSVSASACPPPSLRPFPRRLSDVSVVLRRSVSASARPPPSPRPFQSRWSNVRAVQAQCLYPPSTCSDVRSRQETCYVLRQPDGSCRPKAAVFEAQQDSHLAPRVQAVQTCPEAFWRSYSCRYGEAPASTASWPSRDGGRLLYRYRLIHTY